MMSETWQAVAACIEFMGALIALGYLCKAAAVLLRGRGIDAAKAVMAEGVVMTLDFKMGATLLKALDLSGWPQIGKFAAIFLLRLVLKSAFAGSMFTKQKISSENML